LKYSVNAQTTVKPFGDTTNDGVVQISFTLPVEKSAKSSEAAKQLVLKMGLEEVHVAFENQIAPGFTYFIVYGRSTHSVDLEYIKASKAPVSTMGFDEINEFIKDNIKRKITVVGACIETDAHTVGIDAIFNMKGFAGDYGLERYPMFEAENLGAQVKCENLIREAVRVNADAVLVSTVVTQKDIHLLHLTKLIDMLEAEKLRDRFLMIVGGPRITHELAKELGYNAGFGRGTLPSQVASYIAEELNRKIKNNKS
jgi:beta-lysine 5,6-aminomutase beta subunit